MGKLSNVVYQVPCTCGKIYIGETVRRLDTRLKEHKDACICGQLDKSAIAEHAWSEHHPILWESTKVIDRANRQDILRLKEALHIRLTNKDERFNRDVGMVVPDCWVATINHPPIYACAHACTCALTLFIILIFEFVYHFRPDEGQCNWLKRR